MRFTYVLWLVAEASALQLPFKVPFFSSQEVLEAPSNVPKIAIIGAGAGGSSAAFWIAKAKERFGLHVDIDVYDKLPYVGGRSTIVYPYENKSLPALELGASIFVAANKNLWRASDEFNLTRRNFSEEKEDYEVGIWDGEKVILTVGNSWWDTLKVIWRYGAYAPKRTDSLVKAMVVKYKNLYTQDTPKWDNIADMADVLGFKGLTSQSTLEYLVSNGVSEKYALELVEAATRVNYGQNVDEIHALEGACSLAAEEATGIQGGNFQLFEKFLEYSNATVRLETLVKSIQPYSESSKYWTVATEAGSRVYNAVILAAPFHSTDIKVPSSLSSTIPEQPYVHLHVTLLTTTSPAANPEYFSLASDAKPARMMLTTHNGVRAGGSHPQFNSLSYHGQIRDGEWAVKIFSKQSVSDEDLKAIFGNVGWVYRKEWDAYPVLPPTTEFPPVRLDRGFFYVNAFEPFISTMETETIASRNVVDLLLNEEFKGLSLCGRSLSESSPSAGSRVENRVSDRHARDFVYGFDC